MRHGFICHSGGFLGYTHVVNEMPVFVTLECKTIHEIILLMFLLTQVLLVCILWQSCHSLVLCNAFNMLLVCGIDVGCAQYNVRHYGKHEILLLSTCLLYIYLPTDWV